MSSYNPDATADTDAAENQGSLTRQVRNQLTRVLKCEELRTSKRLTSLLRYVVDETLAGRKDRLKAYTIALEAFDCAPDFDPQTNPMVRIHAAKLRRALERYYLGEGAADRMRIELPKGAYVPVFTEQAPATGAIELASRPTVAVLPLVNLAKDEQADFFAYGLGEELSTQLALIQGLAMINHYATQRYRDLKLDLYRIGRELGARYLITGSILKTPQRLRLALQLNDAESQHQLWGRRYDIALSVPDLLQAQDEIARAIVSEVADYYGAFEQTLWKVSCRKSVKELTAYEAVLRYHHYTLNQTRDLIAPTRSALEHAIEVEPDYALAHAMLGDLLGDIYLFDTDAPPDTLPRVIDCARNATSLDRDDPYGYYVLARSSNLQKDPELAIRSAERIIELDPGSSFMRASAGWCLGWAGQLDRGVARIEASLRLMPYDPGWFHEIICIRFYRRGQFAEALVAANKINQKINPWDPILRAACLGQLGRTEEARDALDEFIGNGSDHTHVQRILALADNIDGFGAELLESLCKAGLDSCW